MVSLEIDNAPDWSTQLFLRKFQLSILLDLTSLSLIYLIIEYGGISQMFKKLDFPSPALFLEKTDII